MSRKYQQQQIPHHPKRKDTPKLQRDPLNFDHIDDMSDFGAQVVNLMVMAPSQWAFHARDRKWIHGDLGTFEVSKQGVVTHCGRLSRYGYETTFNDSVRVLTGGDQRAILAEMQKLATSAIDLSLKSAAVQQAKTMGAVTQVPRQQAGPPQQDSSQSAFEQMIRQEHERAMRELQDSYMLNSSQRQWLNPSNPPAMPNIDDKS